MAVSKRAVMIGAIGGMALGSVTPFLWGDYNSFDLMNVACTTAGGFFGIWAAYQISKRLDL